MYDFPIMNPSDAYSIVLGTTFNVFNFGIRASGRRIFDYMTYAECRYSFAHNEFDSLFGHDIEHPLGLTDWTLNFESGYNYSPDSPERFGRVRIGATKSMGQAIYSIDKVENDFKIYQEYNKEIDLYRNVFHRSKIGIERAIDYRILTWDPVGGFRAKFNLEYGGKYFGSNSSFLKGQADGRIYWHLWRPDYVFADRLLLGLSKGDLTGQERFSLGGQDTLRGYGDGRFRSSNQFLYSGEFRFPIVGEQEDSILRNFFTFNRLNGTAFYDRGVAWDNDYAHTKAKDDVGFGLRFEVTVLGFFEKVMNRLDFAYPLKKDEQGKRAVHVCFNIMQAF
jgi:outer membrane protein assembly factor BamA